jgi:POT family proton-dependent oligopeptide transporter
MLKAFPKMPNGVISLYFIQAFSTFSFAVLYCSLALYTTKQLGLSNVLSNSIVGLFIAFNYILQLLGGVIGGRYLTNRSLFFITIIIQSFGLLILALANHAMLYMGLSLFLVGCGLNTTCYNSMLTQRFQQTDDRRESAFVLNYAAMNIGFCAGYISSGFFDYANQYQYLFYICIATNVMTLCLIIKSWPHLIDVNTPLMQIKHKSQFLYNNLGGVILTLFMIPTMYLCFHSEHFSNGLLVVLSLTVFSLILILRVKQKTKADKQKMSVYLLLAASTFLFWMIYFTGPMGVTLFIKNNVDKHCLGYELATQWIRNINPLVIILGAPVMVLIINKLKEQGYQVTVSIQFVLAFVLMACSFFALAGGIIYSNSLGYTNLYWVIAYIIMQGIAELLLAPVGYALIGRIAPPHLQGVLMGSWMLVSGLAAFFSQYFSNAMVKTEHSNPLLTNDDFLHVFKQLGCSALIGSILLFFISRRIRNYIDNSGNTDKENAEIASLA